MWSRFWNRTFGGQFSRGQYFAWTIIGNILLGLVTGALSEIPNVEPPPNRSEILLALALLLLLIPASLFFNFWCMVRRLHHAGRTPAAAIWHIGIQIVSPILLLLISLEVWVIVALGSGIIFWIGIGVQTPDSHRSVMSLPDR